MRVLYLNLKREYYRQTEAGVKPIEWRAKTPYWDTRLGGREYAYICYRNGYKKDAPEMWMAWRGCSFNENAITPIGIGPFYEIVNSRVIDKPKEAKP